MHFTNSPRLSACKLRQTLQGAAIGLGAGCAGAMGMAASFNTTPSAILFIIAGIPTLTGLLCGLFSKTSAKKTIKDPRTQLAAQRIHMGSRLGLQSFLIHFGLSRGVFKAITDHAVSQPAEKSGQKILEIVEKQYPMVTTITYDSETNTHTCDTIGREHLASARLALLSMDHTKQIPH